MKIPPHIKQSSRVFVYYSSKDKKAVHELCHRLRTDGFETWLSDEHLSLGPGRCGEIEAAVRLSDISIVCISRAAIHAKDHFGTDLEVIAAVADKELKGTATIAPLKLDKCEIPEALRKWHWVDLFDRRGYRQLKKSISRARKKEKPDQNRIKNGSSEAVLLKKEYRYPPGITIATTQQLRDIMRGDLGTQLHKNKISSFVNTMIVLPDRKWLGLDSGRFTMAVSTVDFGLHSS